jgi:hypothetical protein
MTLPQIWHGLVWPLITLTVSISAGLFAANLIESLHWTRAVAKVAAPLFRLSRLKDVSGASFSMAFFSGAAANTMLAEAYEQGKLSRREIILSNLFNSLPTYFLHLPTLFFVAAPFIGRAAVVYVSLTVLAAFLRTIAIVLVGRAILPASSEGCAVCLLTDTRKGFREVLAAVWGRFCKRLPRIVYVTAPIYALFFVLKQQGLFDWLEGLFARKSLLLGLLPPEAMGIVAFHVAAESAAGFAAAGALIDTGALGLRQIVLALLLGNILSSPMRAVRHQFPYYAGIFKPGLAAELIVWSQTWRALSLLVVAAGYALLG